MIFWVRSMLIVLLLISRYMRFIWIKPCQLWVVDVATGLSYDETSFHLHGNDRSKPLENKSDWITKNKSIAFSNINEFFFVMCKLLLQFFAHPVVQNLMKKKWFGTFGKMKRSSWLEVGWWTWIFLNIWCLFDIILFPFLFTLLYIKHRINRVVHRSKGK